MSKNLLSEISYNNGDLPGEELAQIIAHREENIPYLLENLIYTCDNAAELAEQENYMAHIYAMYLLAQFREKRAYPLICRLARLPGGTLDSLLEDVITEGLPNIWASVCDGNLDPLKEIIEDPKIDQFVRGVP